MSLKVRETPQMSAPQPQMQIGYRPTNVGLMGVHGLPVGIPQAGGMAIVPQGRSELPPLAMPGSNLNRAINYYADYGGCGFWRMIWPELLLNGNQRAIINGLTTMVTDPRFYQTVKAVRLQRQATPMQLNFVKFLKAGSAHHGFRICYEIDDIVFKDDIPLFNRCRVAFEDEAIVQSILEMMQMADEISVTCEYMKNYYIHKTGNKNITVIPNMPPKIWFDGYYDRNLIAKNYDKNKKRPRIAYCGSGTHIDVTNRTGQRDDFTHIVNHIIATRKKYQWVMMGCFPLPLKPFIDRGEIEYADWKPLLEFPAGIKALNAQAVIAPLENNTFNCAKSNIKYLEASCIGMPGVFQHLPTYKDAPLLFDSGDDMIDQLDTLLSDHNTYMKYSDAARAYAETMWLDDHLDAYLELYFTPHADPSRKALLQYNPDQASKE